MFLTTPPLDFRPVVPLPWVQAFQANRDFSVAQLWPISDQIRPSLAQSRRTSWPILGQAWPTAAKLAPSLGDVGKSAHIGRYCAELAGLILTHSKPSLADFGPISVEAGTHN